MRNQAKGPDQQVLVNIEQLVEEEHRLFEQGEYGNLDDTGGLRLADIQLALDQCWDLLRQRRALREVGGDPNAAQVRPRQTKGA